MTTTVYSGRVTNWPLVWTMNLLAVALIGLGIAPGAPLAPVLVAAAVIVLTNLMVSSVRTTAGPQGVIVRYGVLGFPRFRYAPGKIETADAVDVPFSRMGGWGAHWSPWRGTRLTIRSGPALRLTLRGGAKVTISAENPAAAVAVLAGRPAAPNSPAATPTPPPRPVEW